MQNTPTTPLVVGTLSSFQDLPTAPLEQCDILELRLDVLYKEPNLSQNVKKAASLAPLLLTARDASEGGANNLSLEARKELLRTHLSLATYLDVELQNYHSYRELFEELATPSQKLILSCHDFEGFDCKLIQQKLLHAHKTAPCIFKAAVTLSSLKDLNKFTQLTMQNESKPIALMGMGTYGIASRLIAIQHHSALVYGYLGSSPAASGQLPASQLKPLLPFLPKLKY